MTESSQGPSKIRNNIVTIPHILLKIIRLFEQPDLDFSTLADTIRQDPVITSRIIKPANSVYFRQWSEVSQLKQLLVVLGLDTVRYLTLLCTTEKIFVDAILNQLFQPTTSHKQGHSGLGLSIVKKLIDQLQGKISCASCAKGTRFQLLLPRIVSERSEHSHA